MTYPLCEKNPFSVLTEMTSDEPLIRVLTIMASSWEGSPKRSRLSFTIPKQQEPKPNKAHRLSCPGSKRESTIVL